MNTTPLELDVQLEIAADIATDIGEGPIWDERTNTLLFVDSTIGRIYRLFPETGALSSIDVGQQIGVAIPRRKGGLVVSARDGLLAVSVNGEISVLVPIEEEQTDHRMNDAKCDSRGRLWSGTFSLKFAPKAGSLYRIERDLRLTRAHGEITVSNGIAWSPDDTKMYFVDTALRSVDVFDYDIETGCATNRRRFAQFHRPDGIPDGISIDAEGYLWVALYLGGAVRRYSPDGVCVGQIKLPVHRVTSCGFGGPSLSDLYITTASQALHDDGRPRESHAGALYRCRPDVSGLPTCLFEG